MPNGHPTSTRVPHPELIETTGFARALAEDPNSIEDINTDWHTEAVGVLVFGSKRGGVWRRSGKEVVKGHSGVLACG